MTQLKIIFCPIDLPAEVRLIDHTTEAMQDVVGGWLELVRLPGIDLWCNEEGVLRGMAFNRPIPARAPVVGGEPWSFVIRPEGESASPGETGVHLIHGPFFLCSSDGEEVADVTDEQIVRWMPILNAKWGGK